MSPLIAISVAQEAERLRAVQPYQQLADKHDKLFGQLAELTAQLFAVPMAQLSLVGADEVTYPGSVGTPRMASRLQRGDSICAVAVYQPEATVFENLRQQPCPWLSAEAQKDFSFYASYPLRTSEGQPIGALCVLGTEPREFSPSEQLILKRMAGVARSLLDLELLAPPAESPALWAAIASRIELSLQRIETLTALLGWEESSHTPAAQAYQNSLHEERLLIVQDIEYQVSKTFDRLRQ